TCCAPPWKTRAAAACVWWESWCGTALRPSFLHRAPPRLSAEAEPSRPRICRSHRRRARKAGHLTSAPSPADGSALELPLVGQDGATALFGAAVTRIQLPVRRVMRLLQHELVVVHQLLVRRNLPDGVNEHPVFLDYRFAIGIARMVDEPRGITFPASIDH